MLNQILLHISNTPLELIEFCQKNDITVEAYSPIAHGEILSQPDIAAMANQSAEEKKYKTYEKMIYNNPL